MSEAEPTRRAGPGLDRLLLVTYSPRLPAGLLSWPAWQALWAGPVYLADQDAAQARAVRAAGVRLHVLAAAPSEPAAGTQPAGMLVPAPPTRDDPAGLAQAFRAVARAGQRAVWLAGPDGDPAFAQALGELVAADRSGAAELEVVYGSWDPAGARLLDVVAVMDRLRSPGGCPWDAAQTHASLAPYLLEEAYEMLEAIEEDDLSLLREELGDVLLQVVFHARLAEERAEDERWSVDDVAGDLVAKLVRRHPHVFADWSVTGAAEVEANWETIKAAEKQRGSVTEGVPAGQPALALAAKLQARVRKAGLVVPPPAGAGIGRRLFDLVADAAEAGIDPEAALREVARAYRDAVLQAEQRAGDG